MFAGKSVPVLSKVSAKLPAHVPAQVPAPGRYPGLAKFLLPCLPLLLGHCMSMSDDKMDTGSPGMPGDLGPLGTGTGTQGQGGDSAHHAQAGELTAGEIDDHLNYPQFKAYVSRALQSAQQPALEYTLPDEADVKDRFANAAPRPKALDLAFAIDATGSMGDEMSYLAAEFQTIVGSVQSRHPDLSIRFGVVFYRDHGDVFVVASHAFGTSAKEMQTILKSQQAGGGGDTPEAMDEGLAAAVALGWRGPSAATQMLFLVADAPPHDAAIAPFLKAVEKAASQGIRIYPLAASSTDALTELLMRIAAFKTEGSYAFLTDDSGIGLDHKEPSVPCYLVTRLDELLTRLIESEIAGARIEPEPASVIRAAGKYDHGHCLE
jgi:hypothetical protein